MTTNDQDNTPENSSTPEDASSYYSQGSHEEDTTEEDFKKPVPAVDPEKEEMSLLKAVAFLGFGMAALAIIFILFFIRDLGHKVGDMDSAVSTLEQKFGPLKDHVDTELSKVNSDVSKLTDRFGTYERKVAITELKRALVAIQGISGSTPPEVQSKSGEVIASIQNLLNELEGTSTGTVKMAPTTTIPTPETPIVAPEPFEAPAEETHATEETHTETVAGTEPTPEEAPVGKIELKSEGETEGGEKEDDEKEGDDDDDDDEEDDEDE